MESMVDEGVQCLDSETTDASTNTSFTSEGDSVLKKRLEAALITNELLQASLEDSQLKVTSLETTNGSLREELHKKEARLTNMAARFTEVATKLEVCVSGPCECCCITHSCTL